MEKNKSGTFVAIMSLVAIVVMGMSYSMMSSKYKKNPTIDVTKIPEISERIMNITVQDYQVYENEQVDFKYIIADVHVEITSDLDLSHLKTNEDLTLDQGESYLAELKKKDVKVDFRNPGTTLLAEGSPYDIQLFIPVIREDERTIVITSDLLPLGKQLLFNVFNNEDENQGEYISQADEVISDSETYQMVVQNAFEITGDPLYQGETEYGVPSTARIFAFNVKASSLKDETLTITSAVYETGKYGVLEAEEGSISSMKYANILGKEISEDSSGYLFFITLDPENEILSCSGTMKITFAGVAEPVVINVEL